MRPQRICHVICFGNELHGDDGFGPAVFQRLTALALPPGTRAYLAGSRGLDALALFEGCDEAIVVDALAPAGRPGRIHELEASAIGEEVVLPGHGSGVGYLLRALAALGEPRPALSVVAAEMAAITPFRPGLSPAMEVAVEAAVAIVFRPRGSGDE
jgi:hydrogenase maturation protease